MIRNNEDLLILEESMTIEMFWNGSVCDWLGGLSGDR